ncbi:MAG: hypothetical protein ACLQUZ_01245 [Rhizomicrobium sp.]
MSILLFEPHFHSFAGHYIRYARVLAREAAQRGLRLRIAASEEISSAVRDELDRCGVEIIPLFPLFEYALNANERVQWQIAKRLRDLALTTFNEQPTQRVAWLSGIPSYIEGASLFAEQALVPFPFQLIDFARDWPTGTQTAPLRVRQSLARGSRFGMKLYAQTNAVSALVSAECGRLFQPFPPILEFTAMRPRAERPRPVVGLMNLSLPGKNGSEALDALAPYTTRLNIVVHMGRKRTANRDVLLDKARSLNATIFDGGLYPDDYSRVWRSLDAVILPYSVEKYRRQGSGMFFESLSDAIIPIVPDGTSMAATAREAGIGIVYDAADEQGLGTAIAFLLANYDRLRRTTWDFAPKWRLENSPGRMFEQLQTAWGQ